MMEPYHSSRYTNLLVFEFGGILIVFTLLPGSIQPLIGLVKNKGGTPRLWRPQLFEECTRLVVKLVECRNNVDVVVRWGRVALKLEGRGSTTLKLSYGVGINEGAYE